MKKSELKDLKIEDIVTIKREGKEINCPVRYIKLNNKENIIGVEIGMRVYRPVFVNAVIPIKTKDIIKIN